MFAALVLQKTYLVSKQALVPSVVRSEAELVEANSKLGVIAGLTGFVAVIPAGAAAAHAAAGLGHADLLRRAVRVRPGSATRLPADVVAADAGAAGRAGPAALRRLQLAAVAMMLLRAAVGFVFFLLAFWLRTQTAGTVWFGVAVGLSAARHDGRQRRRRRGIRGGVPRGADARRRPRPVAVAGLVAALLGGVGAGVLLAVVVNFAAAVGRLAFESIVQRDAPQANRGRAFAQFETRFQLAWAIAGLIPVVIVIPGWVGFLVVGLVGAVAVAQLRRRRTLIGLRCGCAGRAPSPRPPPAPTGRPPPRAARAAARPADPSDAVTADTVTGAVVSGVEAGQPEAGGVDLVRRRDGVGAARAAGAGHRRRPGRRRPARTPCPGRPGPRRGGCPSNCSTNGSLAEVSTRRRRTASAMRSALPPTRRTATASTIQSV